jgi:AraC-like DNA-binding protein
MDRMFSCRIKYKYPILVVLLLSILTRNFAQNQVNFLINSFPDYTPKTDSIFLVTSLDKWINDPHKKFKYCSDGFYRLTIDIGAAKTFEYKINRGNWNRAEGNLLGEYRENRRFSYYSKVSEVKLTIELWQDLHYLVYPPVNVIVQSIPRNTPHDASIYIAGNFNNWTNNDPATKLTENAPGVFTGVIPAGFKSLSFKFTRGTWESAECRWDGGMLSNRTFNQNKTTEKQIVARIESWEDLSTGIIWIKLIFLIFILQSSLLTGLLIYYNSPKTVILLCSLFTIAFLAKFLYASHGLFHLLPYVYFLPVVIYSFIGPLFHLWFKSAITGKSTRISYIHFLPFLPFIWFLQYLRLSEHELYLKIVNNELIGFIFVGYAYALALNLYLNYKIKLVIARNIAAIPNLTYGLYRAVLTNYNLSAVIFVIGGISLWQNIESKFVVDWLDNLLWFGIGIVIIYYEYFFFTSFYSRYTNNFSNKKDEILSKNNWITLKTKLTELMETKGIYSDPNLTLSDIAREIGTNKHYVSKLINEGFKKNFTDYINEYRIKAFISEVESDKNNNTFLFHAFEVGFNSKSSFNRAFKKMTNKTPSEFFSTIK